MPEATKVSVSGGAVFIGSHVVNRLVSDDCSVRIIDNLSTGKLMNINHHLKNGRVDFELAKYVLELAGLNLEILYDKPRLGDIKDTFANISKAKKLLEYTPKFSLKNGLSALFNEEVKLQSATEVFNEVHKVEA